MPSRRPIGEKINVGQKKTKKKIVVYDVRKSMHGNGFINHREALNNM